MASESGQLVFVLRLHHRPAKPEPTEGDGPSVGRLPSFGALPGQTRHQGKQMLSLLQVLNSPCEHSLPASCLSALAFAGSEATATKVRRHTLLLVSTASNQRAASHIPQTPRGQGQTDPSSPACPRVRLLDPGGHANPRAITTDQSLRNNGTKRPSSEENDPPPPHLSGTASHASSTGTSEFRPRLQPHRRTSPFPRPPTPVLPSAPLSNALRSHGLRRLS